MDPISLPEHHQADVCASCGRAIHFMRYEPHPGGYWIHDKPATTGCWPPQDDPDLISWAHPKVDRIDCDNCDGRGEIMQGGDLCRCPKCDGYGVLNAEELGWLL